MKFYSFINACNVGAMMTGAPLAYAVAPANSVITNTATLDYDGLTTPIEASVDVIVGLNPVAPTLSAPVDQTVAENQPVSYLYTITANANGSDAYDLTSSTSVDNLTGTSANATFSQGGATVTQLTLGATAASVDQAAGQTTLTVPSDGVADSTVNNIAAGDTVVINNIAYTVTSVTDNGSTATITLDSPLATAVAVGDLIAEQQEFTATLPTVGSIVNDASPATVDMGVIATSATDPAATATDTTTTTVADVAFEKYVRNVTNDNGASPIDIGGTNYYSTAGGVQALPGDVLEYFLRATAPAGAPLTGASMQDAIPVFTTYVSGSTTLNGAAAADVAGTSPLVSGFTVNSAGEASGTIAAGDSAAVTFQVTVD